MASFESRDVQPTPRRRAHASGEAGDSGQGVPGARRGQGPKPEWGRVKRGALDAGVHRASVACCRPELETLRSRAALSDEIALRVLTMTPSERRRLDALRTHLHHLSHSNRTHNRENVIDEGLKVRVLVALGGQDHDRDFELSGVLLK